MKEFYHILTLFTVSFLKAELDSAVSLVLNFITLFTPDIPAFTSPIVSAPTSKRFISSLVQAPFTPVQVIPPPPQPTCRNLHIHPTFEVAGPTSPWLHPSPFPPPPPPMTLPVCRPGEEPESPWLALVSLFTLVLAAWNFTRINARRPPHRRARRQRRPVLVNNLGHWSSTGLVSPRERIVQPRASITALPALPALAASPISVEPQCHPDFAAPAQIFIPGTSLVLSFAAVSVSTPLTESEILNATTGDPTITPAPPIIPQQSTPETTPVPTFPVPEPAAPASPVSCSSSDVEPQPACVTKNQGLDASIWAQAPSAPVPPPKRKRVRTRKPKQVPVLPASVNETVSTIQSQAPSPTTPLLPPTEVQGSGVPSPATLASLSEPEVIVDKSPAPTTLPTPPPSHKKVMVNMPSVASTCAAEPSPSPAPIRVSTPPPPMAMLVTSEPRVSSVGDSYWATAPDSPPNTHSYGRPPTVDSNIQKPPTPAPITPTNVLPCSERGKTVGDSIWAPVADLLINPELV
ncbi:hypothetical protein C0991_012532 [Blastosporella zonata]|nr:hypothetical protein C0991_012532 [Blastosporella zonata]